MIKKYYEVSCDACGGASHYPIMSGLGRANDQAREDGWIIKSGKYGGHFCNDECYERYVQKVDTLSLVHSDGASR